MGDPKEAGAEASPPGAAARGGLSLLSQAESEEPSSAQVRLRDLPGLGGLRARRTWTGDRGASGAYFHASLALWFGRSHRVCLSSGLQVFACKALMQNTPGFPRAGN